MGETVVRRPPQAIPSPLAGEGREERLAPDRSGGKKLLLATWFSPAFPIGGFSYSHGLETAIAEGALRDVASLEDWIAALLAHGSGWGDAVLAAEAWRATAEGDAGRLAAVAGLAEAMAPSAERHLETMSLGAAFMRAVEAGWPSAALADALAGIALAEADAGQAGRDRVAYPVAVGIAAATHGLPLEATLAAMLNGFVTTLVSVAVKFVPLGQTAGLRVLAALQPLALETAARAAACSLDDLGSAAIASDIASMRHETLYSRIFRS